MLTALTAEFATVSEPRVARETAIDVPPGGAEKTLPGLWDHSFASAFNDLADGVEHEIHP